MGRPQRPGQQGIYRHGVDEPLTGPAETAPPTYAEDRAARRPLFVWLGLGLPALIVAGVVVGKITEQRWAIAVVAIAIFGWIFSNSMYIFVNWPIGIRLDEQGVRIGNVRDPDINEGRRPAPSFQAYRLFSCPWPGVLSMRISQDIAELRKFRLRSRQAPKGNVKARGGQSVGYYLGILAPPFMRAALIIEVDEDYARFPEFRTRQVLAVANSQVGTPSLTWVVPTRQPERLAEVVAAITDSPQWVARRMG
jgi:hypothetical protein